MHLDRLQAIKEEEIHDEENRDKQKKGKYFADQTFAAMHMEVNILRSI